MKVHMNFDRRIDKRMSFNVRNFYVHRCIIYFREICFQLIYEIVKKYTRKAGEISYVD